MTHIEGARAASDPKRLAELNGAVVTTVTAWRHGVTLGFNDSPLAINIEGDVDFGAGERVERFSGEDHVALARRLLDCLGAHVMSATLASDESLTIAFASDLKLIVRADDSGYESYVIFLPDGATLSG